MLGLLMATAIVVDSRASTDAVDLVNQLGSARYALRVSAEGELVRLGRSALPALRAGKQSKDAEIRARSVALLARIENALLLQATPIRLDFRDLPLPEAIEAIHRESGLLLAMIPEEKSALANRRISLKSVEPLPFWKAIDALNSAGNLHPVVGNAPSSGLPGGAYLLLDGPPSGLARVSDSGPFRVELDSLHYQSQIQLAGAQPGPATARGGFIDSNTDPVIPGPRPNREFYLQLVLAAEPRLSITIDGPIKVTAAVDDRGASLLLPNGPIGFQHTAGYFGLNPSSSLHFRVDLVHPDPPARRIQSLRGTIPVVVAMRKPDPLVIPLAGSQGKVFRTEEAALTLLEYRPASAGRSATVQVSIKPIGKAPEPVDHGAGEPLGYRPDSSRQQIELLDSEGRTLDWFPTSTFYNGAETQSTLTVGRRETPGIPTTLRYHGILKAKTDIPFEFLDVPIP